MALWRHLTHGLRVLTRRAAADRDIDDELRHWVDEAAAQHVARGLDPAAARRAALAEIGPPTLVRERVRDHGWEQWVASWLQDLRLAGRTLRQTPLFTAIVVLVVALGSGAVATVFSAMNALLLRPLPGVADPATLVALQPARRDGVTSRADRLDALPPPPRPRPHRRGRRGVGTRAVHDRGRRRRHVGARQSGVRELLRRCSASSRRSAASSPPKRTARRAPTRCWSSRTRSGGRGSAATPARSGGASASTATRSRVIGVAPPAFRGLYTAMAFDAWAPLMMQPQLRPRANLGEGSWLWSFARLRPAIAAPAAEAELSAIVAAHRRSTGAADTPEAFSRMRVTPLTGLPGGGGAAFAFLGVLLGAAALVLVIAGVNVAALLSARYVSRGRDLAVRAALGAGRLRLIRQLLTEVLALFALGALGGFAVASAATAALERLPLPASVPITLEISPDLRVLAFAVAAALAAGLVFGLAPALQGARRDITDRLKAESAGTGRRRSRLGRVLVAGQLALSLVLLVAAGLFVRAVDRGARIDPGFDRDGIVDHAVRSGILGLRHRREHGVLRGGPRAPGDDAWRERGRLHQPAAPDARQLDRHDRVRHEQARGALRRRRRGLLRRPAAADPAGPRASPAPTSAGAVRVAIVNETLARILAPDGDALGRTFRFRDAEHDRRRRRPRRQVRLARRDHAAVLLRAAGAARRPQARPPRPRAGGDGGPGDRRGGARRRSAAAGAARRRVRRRSAGRAVPAARRGHRHRRASA